MKELSPDIISELAAIVGESGVFTDHESRVEYGHDYTEDFSFPPAVVLKPTKTCAQT